MKFMICDKDAYHEIPTPSSQLVMIDGHACAPGDRVVDKYAAIMYNYNLKIGEWYPCELVYTMPLPDMSVYAYDIQIAGTLKYICVRKQEIDDGYVKLDFEEGETDGT